jgi:hypothetical protein
MHIDPFVAFLDHKLTTNQKIAQFRLSRTPRTPLVDTRKIC